MKLRTALKIIRREFKPCEKPAWYKPSTIRKALSVAGPAHWPEWIRKPTGLTQWIFNGDLGELMDGGAK